MKNNKLKNILISLIFLMAFSLPLGNPCFAGVEDNHLDNDISAITKEPVSKKKIAFKFIMAMFGVASSSVIIYVGLSVYNKMFRTQSASVIGLNNLKNLRSPENFKESINVFLKKTDWD